MEKLEYNKENKMVKLIYILNNNPEKETEMKLMLISNNINNKELNAISYGEIEYSFLKFLEQKDKEENEENEEKQLNNIDYKYIGYSRGNGFIKLQKRDFIFLEKDLNKFKIKIIANILNREEKYIKYKQYKIEKEIENIDTKLVSFKKNIRKNPFNLIVLIANPLIHKRELRSMNDFNIIPANIYNLLKEKDFLKYADFQPLTIKTFKDSINKRPDILHLIFKSTYSSNLVNLIFENDKEKYNADFINKEMIDEIFSEKEMRECVKNMTLIISTQLAEDVYNIFLFKNFKNIIVEHTTLANLDLVTEFNLLFYFDLIYTPLNMINNIYEDAMNISFSKKCNTFCCCFHKHKIGCELMINSINELYNDKLIYKLTKLEDLKRIIPHFCHLISECPDNTNKKCEDFNDFCIHYSFNHQKYFTCNKFY